MSDFIDSFLDDEDDHRFDFLREDGWGYGDIAERSYLDAEGRYAGPKAEVEE